MPLTSKTRASRQPFRNLTQLTIYRIENYLFSDKITFQPPNVSAFGGRVRLWLKDFFQYPRSGH